MQIRHTLIACAVAATATIGAPVAAKITEAEAAKLGGKEFTPLGAEVAGNKDGSIPPWTGGLTAVPACYKPGVEYCDPFPGDKPKFEINAANAEQYKDKLPAGALAMLKKYPTFRMPIYETRRTAAVSKETAAIVKDEATKVELNGFAVAGRVATTTPFPFPKNGLEAIWNHLLRTRGGGFDLESTQFPVRPNGDYFKVTGNIRQVFNQNMDKAVDNRLYNYVAYYTAPATLVGTVFLIQEPVDLLKESRAAWIYNAGQRRVRRAPDLGYDNYNDGTEGMRITDQAGGFGGAPDRFEWKLVGKKEMYIPYNAYRTSAKSVKYKDVLTKNHMNPEHMRYELHRVWVLEATVKPGSKHIYAKRTFLLDEDSWNVVWEDSYDSRGGLWRVGMVGIQQYYDAQLPYVRFCAHHDLTSGGYFVSELDNESKGTYKFGVKGKLVDFQPEALRQAGI